MLEPLFTKAAGSQDCSFIKRSLQHRCFPVKFAKLFRAPFFTEHSQWLLLGFSVWNIFLSCGKDWWERNSDLTIFIFSVPFCESQKIKNCKRIYVTSWTYLRRSFVWVNLQAGRYKINSTNAVFSRILSKFW